VGRSGRRRDHAGDLLADLGELPERLVSLKSIKSEVAWISSLSSAIHRSTKVRNVPISVRIVAHTICWI